MEQKKISREEMEDHLLVIELAIISKTKLDTLDVENWQFEWTITRNQYDEFRKNSIKLIQDTFRCRKVRAEETFEFFYKQLGMRISH